MDGGHDAEGRRGSSEGLCNLGRVNESKFQLIIFNDIPRTSRDGSLRTPSRSFHQLGRHPERQSYRELVPMPET